MTNAGSGAGREGQARDGQCACGAVRYRMMREPMFVHCCHCTACQRETGSGFALNALIEAGEIGLLKGAPQPVDTPSESGRGQVVWRCPDCRTALWSNYGGKGDVIRFVRVGTLDRPAEIMPDVHVYVRSKLPWVAIPSDARIFEGYYDTRAEWPADSLERRRTVLAR